MILKDFQWLGRIFQWLERIFQWLERISNGWGGFRPASQPAAYCNLLDFLDPPHLCTGSAGGLEVRHPVVFHEISKKKMW